MATEYGELGWALSDSLTDGRVLSAIYPFDICFVDEYGGEVEPDGTVTITVTFAEAVRETGENALLPLVRVTKVDGKGGGALQGASFVLYYKDENDVPHYYHRGAFSALTDGQTEADYARVTPQNGELLFASLRPDIAYYLKELSAPDGYNKLTQEIVITVDKDGKITVTGGNNAEYEVTGTLHDGQELDLTVKNQPGFELPATGGAGTFPYTIGGTLLTAGCLLCGYLLRSKSERRSAR